MANPTSANCGCSTRNCFAIDSNPPSASPLYGALAGRTSKPAEHDTAHRRVDHSHRGLRQTLVVLSQPTRCPSHEKVLSTTHLRGGTRKPRGFSSSPYLHSCRSGWWGTSTRHPRSWPTHSRNRPV